MAGKITAVRDPGGGRRSIAFTVMTRLSTRTLLTRPRYLLTSRIAVTLVLALGGSAAAAVPVDAARVENSADTAVVRDAADAVDTAPALPGSAVAAAQDLAAVGVDGDEDDVSAVTDAEAWIAALPEEITGELGYQPVVVDGVPSDPEGDCSSPVPLPASFTPACLTHDLGYDLLRVADATGEDIPRGVRPALDRQLASRMTGSCTDAGLRGAGCRAMANVADAAVTANSWRQNDGAPVKESWPWS